jgi:surfeit locus 1 family protein
VHGRSIESQYTVSTSVVIRKFAPSVFATVLTLASIALFMKLGLWQLSRAAEKRELEAQYTSGQQTVIELTAQNAGTLRRYQKVCATGRYDPQHQFLLDNMPSAMGQPGYRVVTAFELRGGTWVLVDRGWRAPGPTRADLPAISVGDEPRRLCGQLDVLPRPGVRLGTADPTQGLWPRVVSFPEHADLERSLGRNVQPGLVLLDPQQPDGYERLWQVRFDLGPQRHIGYAVQWFAFAAAAFVIYIVMGIRRGRTKYYE